MERQMSTFHVDFGAAPGSGGGARRCSCAEYRGRGPCRTHDPSPDPASGWTGACRATVTRGSRCLSYKRQYDSRGTRQGTGHEQPRTMEWEYGRVATAPARCPETRRLPMPEVRP